MQKVISVLMSVCILFSFITVPVSAKEKITLENIPVYTGEAYVELNNNLPKFKKSQLTKTSYETYSELDELGRCGAAMANLSKETMPTEERGKIGNIKPTGWHTVKYDNVSGKYLYNRCHLIGYQLSGENANEENLITGTRYLNTEGMLPFENKVAEYIEDTGNHVLYRVTPIFNGDNLLASGVQMEAYSVEDKGKGICFNVYCYNVQPSIDIDYTNGNSKLADDTIGSVKLNYNKYTLTVGYAKTLKATVTPDDTENSNIIWLSSNNKVATVSNTGKVTAKRAGIAVIVAAIDDTVYDTCVVTVKSKANKNTATDKNTETAKKESVTTSTTTEEQKTEETRTVTTTTSKQTESKVTTVTETKQSTYVLNTNTYKFHKPSCSSVSNMSSKNKQVVNSTRNEVVSSGYVPCKKCNP